MTPKTTTLETSKKLRELGVPQESYLSWMNVDDKWLLGRFSKNVGISAYLSDEIGQWLPEEIHNNEERLLLRYTKYSVHYCLNTNTRRYVITESNFRNEAEMRGEMLIYLIENGYVDIKSLKTL